jgi:hypothetical protein
MPSSGVSEESNGVLIYIKKKKKKKRKKKEKEKRMSNGIKHGGLCL